VAYVEAQEALQLLLRRHRPGSPTVDAAVTELADRSDEYESACDAADQADPAYSEHLRQDTLRDRRLRRIVHAERILAARHTHPVAVGVQQERQSRGADVGRTARTGEGQTGSGPLAPLALHARPEPDESLPGAKRLSTVEQARGNAPNSEPRTMNRLHAWAMGNIAATAAEDAAAAAAAAGSPGNPREEAKADGVQGVEQWFSDS
jgi:hypothetical protein